MSILEDLKKEPTTARLERLECLREMDSNILDKIINRADYIDEKIADLRFDVEGLDIITVKKKRSLGPDALFTFGWILFLLCGIISPFIGRIEAAPGFLALSLLSLRESRM